MIQLFVCDIDGCLAEPYRPFALDGLQQLAEYAASAEDSRLRPEGADSSSPCGGSTLGVRPAVSICSGRPYSYVEAMTQVLDLTAPVLFESGGGLFAPAQARSRWHPDFTDALVEQLDAVRQWMTHALLPGTAMSLDHGKRTQAGLVGPEEEEIAEALPAVRGFLEENAPELRAFATDVSIDVLAPGITKKQGLQWLAGHLGIALSEIAYIGDTEGDLEALESVGLPLAPANASEAVRRAVRAAGGHVTEGRVLEGTLEAYRRCVARNEKALDEKAAAHASPSA